LSRIPGTGIGDLNMSIYSGTLKADLDFADLTAVTAYSRGTFNGPQDASGTFDKYLVYFPFYVPVIDQLDSEIAIYDKTGKFTQEVRLASKPGAFEWMVGGFFTHESSQVLQSVFTTAAATGKKYDDYYLYTVDDPSGYTEYAAFGSGTYHFTDKLDLQLGARISALHMYFRDKLDGLMGCCSDDSGEESANVFTYSITPRYHIGEDMIVYARIATGYRPGGHNFAPDEALSYGPDRTVNYEIGYKGIIVPNLLMVDASLFDIEWKNIQLEAASPAGFNYNENGGEARSRGLEISTVVTPSDGLTIGANFAFVDAALAQDISVSSLYGKKGQPLPFSSKTAGSISVDQEFPISGDVKGSAGLTFNYTGARFGVFPTKATNARFFLPAYGTLDLRVSAECQDWKLAAYARNIFNQVGFTYGQSRDVSTRAGNYDAAVISPRVVGLSLTRNF
jgi:iron complex outermembrane recepter protein